MNFDAVTNSEMFKAAATLVTGGFGVAWYREKRKTKQDAQAFALEFMREQSQRIDKLVEEVAQLKAETRLSSQEKDLAIQELARARAEVLLVKAECKEHEIEITRLKTALGEYQRMSEPQHIQVDIKGTNNA